ncbi:hypothetical protein ZWY2020_001566 [Hordeum vulgare]|nr:hypothetical protein ZWY2020_001566 [Hordeum vulgare]
MQPLSSSCRSSRYTTRSSVPFAGFVAAALLLSFASPASSCTEQERGALLGFLGRLVPGGSGGLNASWVNGTDCCQWDGVLCSGDGTVTDVLVASRGLRGVIWPSLGDLAGLKRLNLSHNWLEGSLPTELVFSRSIIVLDVSFNRLNGHLQELQSSDTGLPLQFSGNIPPGLGSCTMLKVLKLKMLDILNLSSNSLTGEIPQEICNLTNLQMLDLSNNQLTGTIPSALNGLHFLSRFDVSNNKLEGEVPSGGQFDSFSNSSYIGNPKLCGPMINSGCNSRPSSASPRRWNKKNTTAVGLGVFFGGLAILFLLGRLLMALRRTNSVHQNKGSSNGDIEASSFTSASDDLCNVMKGSILVMVPQGKGESDKITFHDILKATNNFDQQNIIGCGGNGLVYKAELPNGPKLAIKKLNGEMCLMEREFTAEVDALTVAKHDNLVPLWGYYIQGNSRLLIYSYMENDLTPVVPDTQDEFCFQQVLSSGDAATSAAAAATSAVEFVVIGAGRREWAAAAPAGPAAAGVAAVDPRLRATNAGRRLSSICRSSIEHAFSLLKHKLVYMEGDMGIYITRWSAKRLREIANTVKGKKRDVISKSSFGDLLHISPLPPPPEALVDFIVMRIDTKKRLLKLTDRKKIPLTRDLVKKIFNVPYGSKPLAFGKREKADFREIYLERERAPIPTIVSVLSNAHDDDEDTIDRTWILLCLSSTTPYATTKFLSYIEQLAQLPNIASVSATETPVNRDADGAQQPTEGGTNEADGRAQNVHEPPPKNTEGGDDVCGSLEDWQHPLPTFEDSEFNVFDSNSQDSDYVSILEKPCCNLIENFKTLVRERNPWKHDLDKFERFNPSGYPQQSTTFDCGLFAILYMENLTAKGLKPFNTDTTSLLNFRKYIAAKLFKHPQNTLSSEEELQKLLKKSYIQVDG